MQLSKSPIKLFKSWRLGHYVKMDAHLWTVQQTFQILTDNPVISIHLESRKPLTCVSKHQSLCILWWHVTLISQCLSLLALTEAILFASCVMSTTEKPQKIWFLAQLNFDTTWATKVGWVIQILLWACNNLHYHVWTASIGPLENCKTEYGFRGMIIKHLIPG